MKKLLFLAALFLSSCITVDDFGSFWDEAVIDPALAGDWKMTSVPSADMPGAKELRFVLQGDHYGLATSADFSKEQSGKPDFMPARTLRAGSYAYLAVCCDKDKHSGTVLARYRIAPGMLKVYAQRDDTVIAWLQEHYPHAANIGRYGPGAQGEHVIIHTFDDETLKILSEIPEGDMYWRLVAEYKKAW